MLMLIPLALLAGLLLRKRQRICHSWETVLPAEFLRALTPDHNGSAKRPTFWQTYWLWPLIAIVASTALAGPSWKQQQTPVFIQQDQLVVVFDLSLSMLASDQKPNRLTRARQKVVDLINVRKQGQTGLVVFAGSSHIVSPLTTDIATFKGFLPALDPFIMPGLGSNVAAGIDKAITLLEQSGARNGRILLLTDGIEAADIATISQQITDSNYQLSIIGMGTADGGPIPIPNRGFLKENNQIVVSRPNYADMQRLAAQTSGLFSRLTIDNRDLAKVLPQAGTIQNTMDKPLATTNAASASGQQTTSNQWHDSGYWLLPVLIMLLLWHFRKAGVTLSVCVLLLLDPRDASAFEWQNLWKTPDQQAMEHYQQGDYESASKIFNDPQWSGTAHYRDGRYEEALAAFGQDNSAISHFNRGNALVELQRFEAALEAYEQASKLDPALTKATENYDKLSAWLEQQKQQDPQQSEDTEQQDQQQQGQQGQQEQGQEQHSQDPQQQDGQQSAQNNGNDPESAQDPGQSAASQHEESSTEKQNPAPPDTDSAPQQSSSVDANQSGDSASNNESNENPTGDEESQTARTLANETDEGADDSEDSAIADAGAGFNSLKDQQTEQWLRRIPDDPGGLLRRKFLQQYQRQNANDQDREPDGSRTLW